MVGWASVNVRHHAYDDSEESNPLNPSSWSDVKGGLDEPGITGPRQHKNHSTKLALPPSLEGIEPIHSRRDTVFL
jgi:hypothetical protein